VRVRLSVENHRGVMVPRTLGILLAVCAVASTLVVATTAASQHDLSRAGWGAVVASFLVFTAGLVDDLSPTGPRGVRNHLRALASGRITTGILKLVVVVSAAIVSVALQGGPTVLVRVAGVVLVAGCANLWNGLDVRPGRAVKFGVLAMLGVVTTPVWLLPTLPGVAVGALLALWPDLRERAMLGDGGANLMGFTIGLGMYAVLSDAWVVVAAVAAVALNVVADTVTLSRVIDAVPPMRWFDRLGRLPDRKT
jgi:UDP-GlcNAc:undecaprenyl-phosphate/decaprenyl-phosphate GlcNAc-1-phosphate transferase